MFTHTDNRSHFAHIRNTPSNDELDSDIDLGAKLAALSFQNSTCSVCKARGNGGKMVCVDQTRDICSDCHAHYTQPMRTQTPEVKTESLNKNGK